ncbi:MAG: dTDP-4-dehydrorhamnose reductase [Deltaproteobacteria bacterium HGW-Deltaproteobacteria-12]|jgi:dTDP-4-dehydrorhamnose reductase|nr:MAG: dTDP-4-dehydrorhamnose reductase [Deltaproteobacteria bacterium HGW-Deltaproteobacteria-12]
MKILLLGHRGMLGSDILYQLGRKYEVTGLDMDEIDISSPEQCRKAIDENTPNVVINAAAYTNVDGCEKERDLCFAVNAEAVKNIAESCRGKNIRLVHFSTDYVFDGKGKEPYTEDSPCHPVNVYGASKLAGELYLQELSNNYILIRTAWLYGKNGKNFVRTILEAARTKNKLEVVDDQIGSPTYTKDIAAAVDLLLERNITGIFHITNRGSCSWFQFTEKILQEAGIAGVKVLPIKSDQLSRPAKRPHFSVLSMQKFIRVTGKTMQPWQLALQDYLQK